MEGKRKRAATVDVTPPLHNRPGLHTHSRPPRIGRLRASCLFRRLRTRLEGKWAPRRSRSKAGNFWRGMIRFRLGKRKTCSLKRPSQPLGRPSDVPTAVLASSSAAAEESIDVSILLWREEKQRRRPQSRPTSPHLQPFEPRNASTSIAAPNRICAADGSRSNQSQQDQAWPRLAPRGRNDEGSPEGGASLPKPPT